MNKYFLWFLVLVYFVSIQASEEPVLHTKTHMLKSFDLRDQLFSTQLSFEFADLPEFKTRVIKEDHLFEIAFFGVNSEEFASKGVKNRIASLPFVESVSVSKIANSGVKLLITIDPAGSFVLVRKYADLSQIVIEFISKKRLGRLAKSSQFLEVAAINRSHLSRYEIF